MSDLGGGVNLKLNPVAHPGVNCKAARLQSATARIVYSTKSFDDPDAYRSFVFNLC